MPSREQLERRVDALAAEYEGAAFADAVRSYSEGLDEEGREDLKAVLLRRARALEDAVDDRFEAKGWLRRTFGYMAADARNRRERSGRGGGGSQQL